MTRDKMGNIVYRRIGIQSVISCREGCGHGSDCCLDGRFEHTWHICNDENCRCHECEPIEGINPKSHIVPGKKRKK